jgi:CII-binding regulator of phage lambda lysogenization HflD
MSGLVAHSGRVADEYLNVPDDAITENAPREPDTVFGGKTTINATLSSGLRRLLDGDGW